MKQKVYLRILLLISLIEMKRVVRAGGAAIAASSTTTFWEMVDLVALMGL